MKKSILLLAMVLMSTVAYGQIQKGDVQLGGNLSYISSETGNFETNTFSITPRASLFISENTSLGLTLGFTNQKINQTESNLFTYGAFARFYKNIAENFYVFLQPGITFANGESNGNDTSQFSFNLTPALAYFVSEKIALEMNVGGLFYNRQETASVDSNSYGLNINLTGLTVGASILLRK